MVRSNSIFKAKNFINTSPVYFDEEKAAEAANDPNYQPDEQHSGSEHLPIVGSFMALFGVIAAWFSSGSSN